MYRSPLLLIAALLFHGCAESEAAHSSDEPNGIALANLARDATASECPNGGFVLDLGVDENANGELDEGEVSEQRVLCNGNDASACSLNVNADGDRVLTCGDTSIMVSGAASVGTGDVALFETVTAGTTVHLSWLNPVGAGFTGVMIRRSNESFPAGPDDGELVYDGSGEATIDEALSPDAVYFYRAFAHDPQRRYSPGVGATALTGAPGSRDPSFAENGSVFLRPLREFAWPFDLAIDSLGRPTIGGLDSTITGEEIAVAWRLDRDGSLDQSFGGGSLVYGTDDDNTSSVVYDLSDRPWVVVAGRVARLGRNGGIDVSFGNDGVLALSEGSAFDLATAPGGGAWVLGVKTGPVYTVSKITDQGTVDTDFGSDGTVTLPAIPEAADTFYTAFEIAAAGDVAVVSGSGDGPDGNGRDAILWRLDSDGSLSTTFSDDGIATYPGGSAASFTSVVIDGSGRAVAVGNSGEGAELNAVIVRFALDGTLDASFGTDGVLTVPNPLGLSGIESFQDVAIDRLGRIVAVGSFNKGSDIREALLVRATPDGSLDSAFGESGVVIERGFHLDDIASDDLVGVKIDPWGRIVATGRSGPSFQAGVSVYRYAP